MVDSFTAFYSVQFLLNDGRTAKIEGEETQTNFVPNFALDDFGLGKIAL